MFCLAVLAIVSTVFLACVFFAIRDQADPLAFIQQQPSSLVFPLIASAITLILIVSGTLYKVVELRRGGGTHVALNMGGRRISPDSRASYERRLLNVVEEMALASGTPVPPVYVLDDDGINAFAAGYSASDAVLGITRGCATRLSREELQGVVAHEFSHVLNGDMRMSIRLIGVLHGILLLGLAGQLILRLTCYSGRGRSRSKDSGQLMAVLLVVSVILLVVGFAGTFLGNLIKAAVSRQREYLADASAIQFTRNPQGIAGALKKIGGSASGSRVSSARAAEASHMFFAKGVFEGFSGLWATHPALDERILAIEPDWDGVFPVAELEAGFAPSQARVSNFVGVVSNAVESTNDNRTNFSMGSEVPVNIVDHAVDHVGEPTEAHRHYAAELLANMPPQVLEAAREPYGSRAVLFALLLDRNDSAIRQSQLAALEANAKPDVVALTRQLTPVVDQLDVRARLPIVDIALPALRSMCLAQYQEFLKCFEALVVADKQLDLFEWMLSQVLVRHLRPQFEQVRSPSIDYYSLKKLGGPCSILLSAIAYAGNSDEDSREAFNVADGHLPEVLLEMHSRKSCGMAQIKEALKILAAVSVKHRVRVVDACAAAICADNHVRWQEAELLRGISDLLDCPMPPLLVREPAVVEERELAAV